MTYQDDRRPVHGGSDHGFRHDVLATPLAILLRRARAVREQRGDRVHTYSPKVFIPVTHLCRDVCHYCTFAHAPRRGEAAYLDRHAVLAIARAGAAAGCTEALFTLGEKPEWRYAAARAALAALGHSSTISYLAELCALVLRETGLLPHVNPGTLTHEEMALLRRVSVSQGMMLESTSERLSTKGGPHYGSPDKAPFARLATIRLAGELQVPFTTGLLIGIGETRAERLDALFALRDLHAQYGHIQEIIVQNFRAKPGTRMHASAEPSFDDLLWTAAVARLVFGPDMHIQVPPNLSADDYPTLLAAGIDDGGGISAVTIDHVNPEAPWPHIAALRDSTEAAGFALAPRLPLYPDYMREAARWVDPALLPAVAALSDAEGFGREDRWFTGAGEPPPARSGRAACADAIGDLIDRARQGEALDEAGIVRLFGARGRAFEAVCAAADALRRETSGDVVRYVVTRNINYTNICLYHCGFCAFSKGSGRGLRGAAYDLNLEEVERRVAEAWDRGATEVCMQGGIHPAYTGATYLALCRAARAAAPNIHIHAFSPLEIRQGAATLGISIACFLGQLRDAGLASLPGTAAEILDDSVRVIICPDKLSTTEWVEVIEAAHRVGLHTTSTILFGHVERPVHWARHLLTLRGIQSRTGGITEFVPLPLVAMEAPIALRGRSRRGPTWREAVLMHAVARLVLHPLIPNIQVSWTKMGVAGAQRCLQAGANDFGGTLMNESISRAAGASHGQELLPEQMQAAIRAVGRTPRMRTTLYAATPREREARAFAPAALLPPIQTAPFHRAAFT